MPSKNLKISAGIAIGFLLFASPSPAGASSIVKVTDASNGKSVTIKSGSTVLVTLKSTFWQFQSVLNLSGSETPTMTAIMPGPTAPANCQLPGMGCGTVTWKFKALKAGKAAFVAVRTSCGEALRCTDKNGRFAVSFKVS